MLAAFGDHDARVRYYACESLYNIAKVARGGCVAHLNEIFDGLFKLSADTDIQVHEADCNSLTTLRPPPPPGGGKENSLQMQEATCNSSTALINDRPYPSLPPPPRPYRQPLVFRCRTACNSSTA